MISQALCTSNSALSHLTFPVFHKQREEVVKVVLFDKNSQKNSFITEGIVALILLSRYKQSETKPLLHFQVEQMGSKFRQKSHKTELVIFLVKIFFTLHFSWAWIIILGAIQILCDTLGGSTKRHVSFFAFLALILN